MSRGSFASGHRERTFVRSLVTIHYQRTTIHNEYQEGDGLIGIEWEHVSPGWRMGIGDNLRGIGYRFHTAPVGSPVAGRFPHRDPTHCGPIMSGVKFSLQFPLPPAEVPEIPGYRFAFRCQASGNTAADFYDVVELRSGKIAFVFCDGVLPVEGVGPGLFSAGSQALLRMLLERVEEPQAVLAEMNALLHAELAATCFAMCSLLIIDPEAATIQHVGAGHQAYLIDGDGHYQGRLSSTGLPLGLFEDAKYTINPPTELEENGMLLLLSDGFQQTFSPYNTLFGMDRVFQSLHAKRLAPPDERLEFLFSEVDRFRDSQPQRDDLTAFLLDPVTASRS